MLMSAAVVYLTLTGAPGEGSDGPPFPRIANCYFCQLSPTSTEEDLAEIARIDLLIGGCWADWSNPEHLAKMRELFAELRRRNPHIVILDFSSSAPYADPRDASFPADGWLLQADGRTIDGWPGTRMANLTRPEVREWLTRLSVRSVTERGFDGTFIDCMGDGFDDWACNIASGEPYTVDADRDGLPDDPAVLKRAWVEAKTDLARRVREAIGPETPFMTNQARDWGLPYMNGILFEDDMDYVLDRDADWERIVALYRHWCDDTRGPNLTTLVSSSGIEPPYDAWQSLGEAERNALLERGRALLPRMRFGLCTALMGDGYYAYDLHTRWRGQRWWYPEYDAPLGYPKGAPERLPEGVWQRQFDGGTVFVNPTLLDHRALLDDRREDVSSGKVGRAFLIPARDGRILVHTEAPEQAGRVADPSPILDLRGPAGIVERDDRILCRAGGRSALFDSRGTLRAMWGADGLLAAEGLRAFLVTDDRWRDYGYEDVRHEVTAQGDLRFTGLRTDGTARIAFEQTVGWDGDALVVALRWTAESEAPLHMARLQLDIPVARYGGGEAETGAGVVTLPREISASPVLVRDVRTLTLRPERGRPLVIHCSGPFDLVDERHYGVAAFRIGHHPAPSVAAPGASWAATLRLTTE